MRSDRSLKMPTWQHLAKAMFAPSKIYRSKVGLLVFLGHRITRESARWQERFLVAICFGLSHELPKESVRSFRIGLI